MRTPFACLMMIALASSAALGQSVVRVRVVDSVDAPIADADVSIVRGRSTTLAHGTTNAAGELSLVVPPGTEYQLVARRLGFERGTRFFSTTVEPMALTLRLARKAAQLAAVNVTEYSRRTAYRVGADEIAESPRPVVHGVDVITKLRPLIFDPTPRSKFNACYAENVWVNGKRIVYAPTSERMMVEKREAISVRNAIFNKKAFRTPGPLNGIASVPLNVLSVLESIRAEHIEEINYTDCEDKLDEGVHTSNSVFVTLKSGIGFEVGSGSFVIEQVVVLAANRPRIVGVFDEESGIPLPGVELTDSASHAFVSTTETGTATLAFLPDGSHVMWLRKKGYASLRVLLEISERDSLPVTLTLSPQH